MKKLIIGSVVGGLILFIWQFLSFMLLDLHYSQMAYTPAQDQILEALNEANIEDGEYYMIRAPKGVTEGQEALTAERMGKPWAMVNYHSSLENNMGMNMFRGFVIDLVAVLILCWILLNFANLDMKTAVLSSVGVAIIGYLVGSYLNSVWYQTNSLPYLIDAIVPWAAIGCWLGWWLKR